MTDEKKCGFQRPCDWLKAKTQIQLPRWLRKRERSGGATTFPHDRDANISVVFSQPPNI